MNIGSSSRLAVSRKKEPIQGFGSGPRLHINWNCKGKFAKAISSTNQGMYLDNSTANLLA